MRRLWLLLALLLSLLPTPAAASERAPESGETHYVAAAGDHFGDELRAGTGFEILAQHGRGERASPRGACAGPEARTPLGAGPLSSAIHESAVPAPAGSAPLCERLPYHATAPPHRG